MGEPVSYTHLIGRRAQLFDLIAEFGGAFIILSCHCQGKLLFQIADGMGFRFAFFGPFRRFPVMVGILSLIHI